jgi:hypothetical protein
MPKPRDDAADQAPDVHVVPLASVVPDEANARVHPEDNKNAIRRSLKRFGAGRSIVLDRDGIVRAGNGTVEAAREVGFDEVLVVKPKPGQLVAVQRDDWSATEATANAIVDNKSTDMGEFNNEILARQLSALREDGVEIEDVGFSKKELDRLLKAAKDDDEEPEGEDYEPKFELVVECADEPSMQALYDELTERDLKCRPMSL